MMKEVPQAAPWRSLMLRHGDLKQRLYYLPTRWALPACLLACLPACLVNISCSAAEVAHDNMLVSEV
jgi:hypothetical protein